MADGHDEGARGAAPSLLRVDHLAGEDHILVVAEAVEVVGEKGTKVGWGRRGAEAGVRLGRGCLAMAKGLTRPWCRAGHACAWGLLPRCGRRGAGRRPPQPVQRQTGRRPSTRRPGHEPGPQHFNPRDRAGGGGGVQCRDGVRPDAGLAGGGPLLAGGGRRGSPGAARGDPGCLGPTAGSQSGALASCVLHGWCRGGKRPAPPARPGHGASTPGRAQRPLPPNPNRARPRPPSGWRLRSSRWSAASPAPTCRCPGPSSGPS